MVKDTTRGTPPPERKHHYHHRPSISLHSWRPCLGHLIDRPGQVMEVWVLGNSGPGCPSPDSFVTPEKKELLTVGDHSTNGPGSAKRGGAAFCTTVSFTEEEETRGAGRTEGNGATGERHVAEAGTDWTSPTGSPFHGISKQVLFIGSRNGQKRFR